MPLKCRDTSADHPRNEIEGEEEETVVTRNGQISGAISDMLTPLQLDHYWSSSSSISFLYIRGVSRRVLGSIVREFVRRSCITISIILDPSRNSWRSYAEVVPCDRYTKYYKSHGAVCLFRSRRRHGVHGAACDWGITHLFQTSNSERLLWRTCDEFSCQTSINVVISVRWCITHMIFVSDSSVARLYHLIWFPESIWRNAIKKS